MLRIPEKDKYKGFFDAIKSKFLLIINMNYKNKIIFQEFLKNRVLIHCGGVMGSMFYE